MKKAILLFIVILMTLFLIGCAGSRLNISKSATVFDLKTIALMPGGGVLADAIGIELLRYGFDIIDPATITSCMVRLNLTEIEFALPQNLKKLADEGIDAVLLVKSVSGYDNRPNSASIKLVSTATGRLLIGATWQTGKGGALGSPADAMMRKDISAAAHEIATGIGNALKE